MSETSDAFRFIPKFNDQRTGNSEGWRFCLKHDDSES